MIKIAVAEDHQALIDGIELFFEYDDDINVVGTAKNGEELLEIVRKKRPDLVLTDIRMPKMDGIELTKIVKKEFPKMQVIAFTMYDQDKAVQQMLDAGAKGYILKNASLETVKQAIETVVEGNAFYGSGITPKKSKTVNNPDSLLTPRQLEILQLVGQGRTSREIANQLNIGLHTVNTHRRNMASILGLKGSGELMRYALDKKYKF